MVDGNRKNFSAQGALEVTKKDLKKLNSKISGNNSFQEIQKTTLMGSADILRKVLSIKRQTIRQHNPLGSWFEPMRDY